AFHPIHLDVYCGLQRAPGQVTHSPFAAVVGVIELARAPGTLQFAVPALAPYPQLQDLVLLVDLVPVHAVTGPLQDSRKFVVAGQPLNLTQNPIPQNAHQFSSSANSRAEPKLETSLRE